MQEHVPRIDSFPKHCSQKGALGEELEGRISSIQELIKRKRIVFFSAKESCIDRAKIYIFQKIRDYIDQGICGPIKGMYPEAGAGLNMLKYHTYVTEHIEFAAALR